MADVHSFTPLNVSYRSALVGGVKSTEWFNLVANIAQINLNEDIDLFWWSLRKNVIS